MRSLIGVAMIIGLFVGIAAFFGGVLNFSFGLAGVAGVNPMFFVIEVLLILAWRNAGYHGRRPLRAPEARHAVAQGNDVPPRG